MLSSRADKGWQHLFALLASILELSPHLPLPPLLASSLCAVPTLTGSRETRAWSCILALFSRESRRPELPSVNNIPNTVFFPNPASRVPNFPRLLGSLQILYFINLYQIPGIPFQTRGNKSIVICHLFDTGIVVIDLKSATQNLTLWENVGSILAQQVANDNYEDESLTYSLKTAWNSFSVICLSTGRGIAKLTSGFS